MFSFLFLLLFLFFLVLVSVLHLVYSLSRSSRCLPFHYCYCYCYRYYCYCASYFPSFIFWLNCSSLGGLQQLSLLPFLSLSLLFNLSLPFLSLSLLFNLSLPFLSFLYRVATCLTRLHICRILILARMIIFLYFSVFMFATAVLLFIIFHIHSSCYLSSQLECDTAFFKI